MHEHKKGGPRPPFLPQSAKVLLAEMPAAVFAAEVGAGGADKTVLPGIGIARKRCGGDGCRGADRPADDAGCDIARPEAGVAFAPAVAIPAVVAVVPGAVVP